MNTKQLLLSAIAVTLPLWTVSAHADAAWDLYEQMKAGRCELALADVKTRAEAGEASFQRVMGVALAHGTCTSRSHGEAAAWYRKAAQQGDADAQNNLGAMHANGLGVPKDERQAVDWYRKAVEQGHATAQNNLGIMYANGQGVLQDAVQAAAWFERAARQGDAWGQRNLGLLLRDGSGVARDPIRAHAGSTWPARLTSRIPMQPRSAKPWPRRWIGHSRPTHSAWRVSGSKVWRWARRA